MTNPAQPRKDSTFSRVSADISVALNKVKWVMKGGAVVADQTKGEVR